MILDVLEENREEFIYACQNAGLNCKMVDEGANLYVKMKVWTDDNVELSGDVLFELGISYTLFRLDIQEVNKTIIGSGTRKQMTTVAQLQKMKVSFEEHTGSLDIATFTKNDGSTVSGRDMFNLGIQYGQIIR